MIKNQKRLTSAYGAKASAGERAPARSDASTFAPPNITAFKIDTVGRLRRIYNKYQELEDKNVMGSLSY